MFLAQWARPIFGVQTNFKDISKEEREERDKFNAAEYKKRRLRCVVDANSVAMFILSQCLLRQC